MNEVQIFNNPDFGKIRTVVLGEKEYFYGSDIATALRYKRPSKAVTDNCKGVLYEDTIKNNGGYPEPLIPEGDVYRLIIKAGQQGNSKDIQEIADKLERFIFDEVLPSIRKTGSYGQNAPLTLQQQIQTIAKGTEELYQRVDEVKFEVDVIRSDLENFKNDLPVLPEDADKISDAVKKKGVQLLGGKQSAAYLDNSIRRKLYSNLYWTLKYNFNVRSYKNIKRTELDRALEVVENCQPPVFLSDEICMMNSQRKLDI